MLQHFSVELDIPDNDENQNKHPNIYSVLTDGERQGAQRNICVSQPITLFPKNA